MAANQQDFLVKNGMTVRNTATISTLDSFLTTATFTPNARPNLDINFIGVNNLDSRITFSRATGGTYVDKDGLIKYASINQPRFDYSSTSTGTAVGILMEESRTNLLTYSQDISQTGWSSGNVSRKINAAVAPDGSLTAGLITATPIAYGGLLRNYTLTLSTNTVYTMSVFAKAGTSNYIGLRISGDSATNGDLYPYYNLSTGAATTVTPRGGVINAVSMVQFPNGWWRCNLTFTTTGTIASNLIDVSLVSSTGGTGQVYAGTESAYVWGAQLEQAYFPTSYIPTASAQVNRANENMALLGQNFNSWWRNDAGTLFIDAELQYSTSTGAYPRLLSITDATGGQNNVYQYIGLPYGTGSLQMAIWVNGGFVSYSSVNTLSGQFHKMAFSYDATTSIGSPDGTTPFVNSTGQLPTSLVGCFIGNVLYSNGGMTGHIRRFTYWPQKLSGVQLQSLSSATTGLGTSLPDVAPRNTRTASTSNFTVQQGVVVSQNFEVPDVDKYYVTTQTRPTQQPTLNLNFLTGRLDPRITFTRASGATVVGPDGYIKYVGNNTPRFQYSSTSTGTCQGLLIESQRTNIKTYSYNIGNINGWIYQTGASDSTATFYAGVAPDGSQDATLLSATTSTLTYPNFFGYVSLNTATTYTSSFFVKPANGKATVSYGIYDTVSTGYLNFIYNFNTDSFTTSTGGATASIVVSPSRDIYPNGWYRLQYSYSFNSGPSSRAVQIKHNLEASGSPQAGQGLYFWGTQVEQGAFATSYIPTVSASATRAADNVFMSGQNFTSWNNPSQGTYFAEGLYSPNYPNFASVITTRDNPGNNYINMYQYSGLQGGTVRYGTNIQLFDPLLGYSANTGTFYRQALTYKSNSYYSTFNGAASPLNVDSRVPFNIDRMYIGGNQNGDGNYNSVIRRLVYYPVQLTTATMQTLTSSTYI